MVKITDKPIRGPRPFSLSKITAIIGEMGLRGAIVGTLLFLLRFWRSWWWDRSHNVTTRHRIPLSDLDITGPSATYARFYEPSDTKCLPALLRRLNIQYSEFVFIDFGAGQGKTMLLAAEFPFKRVLGVEISPMLSKQARANCESFRGKRQACNSLEVRCGDAAEFTFPNVPLVIYMFNPFSEEIISRMLMNLAQSISMRPREVFLIYYNPLHCHAIQSCRAFELCFEGTDEWDYRKLRYNVFRATKSGLSDAAAGRLARLKSDPISAG
jgi:hypothetical protein